MKKIKNITEWVWFVCGVLLLAILLMAFSIGMEVRVAVKDMQELWAQVTIEDVRDVLRVVEKDLDADLWDLMIQHQRSTTHLEFTPENWQAFLDFCGRTGYVVSDYNWQRYISGQLSYK